MPTPASRDQLIRDLEKAFDKLQLALDDAGPRLGSKVCVDEWTVKELLIVRVWWVEQVRRWIIAGVEGKTPITPAEGYKWSETPRLNQDSINQRRRDSYRAVRESLLAAHKALRDTVETLTDEQLLEPHIYEWAGKWPLARWISINTTRQYTTALAAVRKAIRSSD